MAEIVCPKCHYVNTAATGVAMEECPKCGVIYSKVGGSAPLQGSRESQQYSPAAPGATTQAREVRIPLSLLVACTVCLVVGFVAGREQMRYQIATSLASAFSNLSDHRSPAPEARPSATTPPVPALAPPTTPEPQAAPEHPAIAATLISKSFRNQDFSGANYVKAAITFSVEFQNDTEKDIRAFDGVLSFNDLLGNRVLGSKLTISDPIRAGKTIKWDGELNYNEFISEHSKLRGYSIKDLKVVLQPHKILFADGTEQLVQQ